MFKESKYIKSKPNILSILLERYPKKRWNYIYVAENPYGIEYIKNHPEKIWNTDLLNRNNNIDIEVVKLYRERYWNWDILSRMPNMSIEVIVSNPKLPWNLWQISKNPSVSVEDIEKYPDLPWNYNDLSSNPNITAEFIESHINYNWNWDKLFTNINLPESFVYKHLDPSTIKYHHPSWTSSIQYYIDNVDKINFLSLSRKENLTQEIIERYIDEDWDWYCISASNKNITVPFVEKYKKYFHFNYLSQNPIIRPELIENNLKEDWNWNWIAKNPGIPVEYTIRYIDIKNIRNDRSSVGALTHRNSFQLGNG
jgi:hypothetical protein